jgi:hypothetical protein
MFKLNQYPKANEIIKELGMEEKVDDIKWLQMGRDTAAVSMAKLLLVGKALRSSSIPTRNTAKEYCDLQYNGIGNSIHVFAKEEGRSSLNFTNEDVTRLYSHIELGGNRYGKVRR